MTMQAYKFYTITGDDPFMSADNLYIKGNISDEFCWIILHNHAMHEAIDITQDGIFVKNISKPFSNRVFIKAVDAKFEGNIARLKVHGIGLEYLLIDSFGNDLCKLPQTERVWLNKSDKWKRYYLTSIYAQFGFAMPKTNEIIIEGEKIFREIDFYCEVGFTLNNQWGFIGYNSYHFEEFLTLLSDDVSFIWKDYSLSQERLNEWMDILGVTVFEELENLIKSRHKLIYC